MYIFGVNIVLHFRRKYSGYIYKVIITNNLSSIVQSINQLINRSSVQCYRNTTYIYIYIYAGFYALWLNIGLMMHMKSNQTKCQI